MDQEQYAELLRIGARRQATLDAERARMDNILIHDSIRAGDLYHQLMRERAFAEKKADILLSMCIVIRYPHSESRWRIDPVHLDDWIDQLLDFDVTFKVYQRQLGVVDPNVNSWVLRACRLIFDSTDPYFNGRLSGDGI